MFLLSFFVSYIQKINLLFFSDFHEKWLFFYGFQWRFFVSKMLFFTSFLLLRNKFTFFYRAALCIIIHHFHGLA